MVVTLTFCMKKGMQIKTNLVYIGVLNIEEMGLPSKQKIFISYSVYLAYMFCENMLKK